MKLIDMKRPPEKSEDKASKSQTAAHEYHYGTLINLEKRHIDKLDISHLNVGDEVSIHAKAKVASKSSHTSESGNDHHSMGLQITHMGVGESSEVGQEEPSMRDYAKKRNAEIKDRT